MDWRALLRRLGRSSSRDVRVELKAHDLSSSPPFYDATLLATSTATLRYGVWDRTTGLDSNVIMAPIMWIMRTFVEARPVVQRRSPRGVWELVPDHPLELLLDEPNPYYDGDALWQASLVSFLLDGNAYWRLARNAIGEVVEIWYLPHMLVTPRYPSDGSRFLDYYEYRPWGGRTERLLPRDVVHFRFGLDPRDPRLGLSPIRPLLREIYADDEAALFSAAILRNMGVPGLVVSPRDPATRPSPQDIDELKRYLDSAFAGSSRGRAMVLGVPTDVAQFGFDANKLMLPNLRDISEERVCAMLGLPAAVVGFGSGMQSTKVGATMRELVRMAWVGCLSPLQGSLARQVTRQLIPEFQSQTSRYRVAFDTSEVAGFSEDASALAERATRLVQAGILRIDQAQEMLGLEVDDTQQVYLRPLQSAAVTGALDAPEPIPPAVARRNGATAPTPTTSNA